MRAKDERVRMTIAGEAAEWFVANHDGLPDAVQCATFIAWLRMSPLHVEEYLGVALIARDLRHAVADPQLPLEALLARARSADDTNVLPIAPRLSRPAARGGGNRWKLVAAAAAVLVVIGLAFLWSGGDYAPPLRYATRHGEQSTQRLADNSVLRLNTDTVVIVRYARAERLVELERGQVLFEVAHQSQRPFRVLAGAAQVVAVGTSFEVYRQPDSTLVTVVEGQVAVGLAAGEPAAEAGRMVRVGAGQQIRIAPGNLPATAAPANLHRSTAWLRREIVFEQEPLEAVAAEFNRYSTTPIQIETPALRTLVISGVLSANDTESFIAFLRSLEGVRVEVTATHIRVLKM